MPGFSNYQFKINSKYQGEYKYLTYIHYKYMYFSYNNKIIIINEIF